MIQKAATRIALLGLVFLLTVETGHSTMLIIQKEVSISRTLTGHVFVRGADSAGRGITVELCSPDWKDVLASTKTDEKGYFSLKRPATGKLFYIRLSAPGMDIYQLRVRIKRHGPKELTIHLTVAT